MRSFPIETPERVTLQDQGRIGASFLERPGTRSLHSGALADPFQELDRGDNRNAEWFAQIEQVTVVANDRSIFGAVRQALAMPIS